MSQHIDKRVLLWEGLGCRTFSFFLVSAYNPLLLVPWLPPGPSKLLVLSQFRGQVSLFPSGVLSFGLFRLALLALSPAGLRSWFFPLTAPPLGNLHLLIAVCPGASSHDPFYVVGQKAPAVEEGKVHSQYPPPALGPTKVGNGEASLPLSCPYTLDSVPATVPSVTASPADPELLGPLSVLYAALIAKLLEMTVPFPGRDPSSGRRVAEFWWSGCTDCRGDGEMECVMPKAGRT